MALVAYSDSESDSDRATSRPPVKRLRHHPPVSNPDVSHQSLPPLPAAFHDLYATSMRTATHDDPTLHAGRKRAIPHMDGHWPSHLYLEWHPNSSESSTVETLLQRVQAATSNFYRTASTTLPKQHIHTLLLTPLSTRAPLHISLSRTLPLPTDKRQPFLDALTARIRASGARPFDAALSGLKWVPNYDRSRWFLVIGVRRSDGDALNKLLLSSNQTAKAFGYPELYSQAAKGNGHGDGVDMSGTWGSAADAVLAIDGKSQKTDLVAAKDDRSQAFHISLAWSLEAPPDELFDISAEQEVKQWLDQEVSQMAIHFDIVKAKVGNAIHSIGLSPKRHEEKGILG
ncbi:U6 snRNA phosphodiesterase Usb1 [Phyllosticta citribraziliensis]|uniref:U6 snRNA phosphodiesterase n=1 Tax=Phyllosticta citribraziliensis TaxID=989973 RepID=A0ABR1M728_9PEZI